MTTCSLFKIQIPIPQKVVKAKVVILNSASCFQLKENRYLATTEKIILIARNPIAAIPIPKYILYRVFAIFLMMLTFFFY